MKYKRQEATIMAAINSNSIEVKALETKHLLIMPGETPGGKMRIS